jgi:hypothetical protein
MPNEKKPNQGGQGDQQRRDKQQSPQQDREPRRADTPIPGTRTPGGSGGQQPQGDQRDPSQKGERRRQE